ncbi:MAG: DUF2156 domain-containing protein [Nitrospirae bacterium]|nr:DUF2156 domain-containing protein [Candidatus Manganitrophaceae bacterium]
MIALKPLLPESRSLFDPFLQRTGAPLSAYSFVTHFLWQGHFSFFYHVSQDHLLLFARYDRCIYMPLPPLGPPDQKIIFDCFDWMDRENPDRAVSRIENIAEAETGLYRASGLTVEPKDPEYLCRRIALAELKGDRYKSQRAACNYFEKQFQPVGRPYRAADEGACRDLFRRWAGDRAARHSDTVYRMMLQDAESVHSRALAEADALGLVGRVVAVDEAIVGYTFGFPQNAETFCVFLEVTDPEKKGGSAYLFREFCRTLVDFQWINLMDDSGIPSLRRTKESYRPTQKTGCFLARHGAA